MVDTINPESRNEQIILMKDKTMKKTVLLYNFDEEELPKVKRALLPLKFFIRTVKEEEYDLSVGFLAGLSDDGTSKKKAESDFGKLVVMGGFLNSDLDKLLAAMRKAGFSRDVLKAVITPTNDVWSGPQLYAEICKAHKLMNK